MVATDTDNQSTSTFADGRIIAKFVGHVVIDVQSKENRGLAPRSMQSINDYLSVNKSVHVDSWISGISFERSAKNWDMLFRECVKREHRSLKQSSGYSTAGTGKSLGELGEYAEQLRDEASRLGIDFDKLLKDASRQFESPEMPIPQEYVPNSIVWETAVGELNPDDY